MTWWKALANSIAHGEESPLSAARVVVWQCEECGGRLFRVIAWDEWSENDEHGPTKYNRFVLKCQGCGQMEADMTVSKCLW